MNRCFASLVAFSIALSCGPAMAAPQLTQSECHDYPFVPLKHEVTHKQLMEELSELEAVGYQPAADENDYPQDLNVAEAKLRKEYRQECAGSNVASAPSGAPIAN